MFNLLLMQTTTIMTTATTRTNTPTTAITIYITVGAVSSVWDSACTVVPPSLVRVSSPGCSEYTVLPDCFFVDPCPLNDVVVRWKIVLALVSLLLVVVSIVVDKGNSDFFVTVCRVSLVGVSMEGEGEVGLAVECNLNNY